MMEDVAVGAGSDSLAICSVSSLDPSWSTEEMTENAEQLKIETTEAGRKEGRARKLLQKYKLVIPELAARPSSQQENDKIDLADPSEKIDPWLASKFPAIKKRTQPLQCQADQNLSKLSAQERVKKDLFAKMALRRKAEQAKRRELYAEDNEGLLGGSEDEEEEPVVQKTKTKVSAPKPMESDNSEDDEDYVENNEKVGDEADENDEDSSDDEEKPKHAVEVEQFEESNSLEESVDIFSGPSPATSTVFASQPVFPVTSSSPQLQGTSQFPLSLSQWYSPSDKRRHSKESVSDEELSDELNRSSCVKEPIKTDDLLMFCSGQFGLPEKVAVPLKTEEPQIEETEDEVIIRPAKKKHLMDSDDEDEDQTKEAENEDEPLDSPAKDTQRKAVIVSDDENEDEEAEDEVEDEQEEEEEAEEPENGKVEDAGNESDDELAVIRRLENQEFRKKLKKKKFFDDEASLSGSDVGSDLDEEEEGANEYDPDECDNEEYDEEDLRNKNHRLYLKQQQQQVHREIAKLQDRLLADGDLAGVETNRTFRVRLREDVEINMDDLNDFSQDTIEDNENPEDEKKRSDALKFKAEMHNVLSQAAEIPPEDDIERAARAALLAESDDPFEREYFPVGKTRLANVFKDLSSTNSIKQLYTSTTTTSTNKRVTIPFPGQAKKPKITLFDKLEE